MTVNKMGDLGLILIKINIKVKVLSHRVSPRREVLQAEPASGPAG